MVWCLLTAEAGERAIIRVPARDAMAWSWLYLNAGKPIHGIRNIIAENTAAHVKVQMAKVMSSTCTLPPNRSGPDVLQKP